MVKIRLERENKEIEIDFNGKVKTLLEKIDINPEEVVVVRGDEILTEEDTVGEKDSIRVLSVISGG